VARIVLDAGVIIGLYDDRDPHHKWAVDFMFQTTADKFIMSAINHAEIMVYPMKAGVNEAFKAGIQGLGVKLDVNSLNQTESLAKLRAETGLKMTDVCSLHLALSEDSILATTDKDLAKAALERGIEVFQP
jgi:predicted nucleic acid-binding protein